ncbi:MAG: hypothetical protein PVG07_02280 [Acidobacteriota bacterium]|jgi:hypothetical protein
MREQTVRRSGAGQGASLPISDQVSGQLAPYLGEFNAKVWVKVVADRDLGMAPEELEREHVEPLLEGLRASLNTFLGRSAAGDLCRKIVREVG